jgi:hypothetical protein
MVRSKLFSLDEVDRMQQCGIRNMMLVLSLNRRGPPVVLSHDDRGSTERLGSLPWLHRTRTLPAFHIVSCYRHKNVQVSFFRQLKRWADFASSR